MVDRGTQQQGRQLQLLQRTSPVGREQAHSNCTSRRSVSNNTARVLTTSNSFVSYCAQVLRLLRANPWLGLQHTVPAAFESATVAGAAFSRRLVSPFCVQR